MNVSTAEKLFSSYLDYSYMGEETVVEAKKRFAALQADGIIKDNCTFEANVWHTTDQYKNIGLYFNFNRFSYAAYYQSTLQLTFECFVNSVKCYLLSIFGQRVLSTIESILLDLRRIIATDINELFTASSSIRIALPSHCIDFFCSFRTDNESEELEDLLEALDSCSGSAIISGNNAQRNLADFDSYFLFDEILKKFWDSQLDTTTRLFFYPLYLWWSITAVLPLRPREFLVTERNCLTQDKDGNYFLRVRRNKLKGGHTSITYKIADDYEINTYRIPDKLAKEIQQYIELTKHLDETELQTLFVLDPHYKQWGRSKSRKNRYLTYVNMNTILRYFFKTVIIDQYHFTVCYDHPNRHLNNNEICYIHLGDTRHIALINMMQEGATPVIAMMLAGHTNMVTASHYYSNVTTLLECKTYRQCRKLLHGDNTYQITASIANPHFDKLSPKTPLSDGGYCISEEHSNGSILDCLKATGTNGEIGYCPTCVFYRSSTGAFFSSDDIYKQNLSADCEALVQAVRVVRAHQGNVEDIGEALLRVRASSSSYEKFLLSKKLAAKEG